MSTADQLYVFDSLRAYLGAELSAEHPEDLVAQQRTTTLAAVRRVAEHLHLPEGKAPTAAQFRRAPDEVTEGVKFHHVEAAWSLWRFVQMALREESVPESPQQRAVRRQAAGKEHQLETPVHALHLWWASNPVSTTTKDYDAWAREYNRDIERGRTEGKRVPGASAVQSGLGLGWSQVLRVARGEVPYDELVREQEAEIETEAGALGLIGARQTALLLGLRTDELQAARSRGSTDIPAPAVQLGNQHGWVIDDVVAHRDGRSCPDRNPTAFRKLIMDSNDVAAALGMSADSLRAQRHRGVASVPPEDGRIGTALYWVRENVERWMRERGRAVRSSSVRQAP